MVRLLLCPAATITLSPLAFQSHNGAIATPSRLVPPNTIFAFNPTMVRLLRLVLLRVSTDRIRFQSHNGAIATRNLWIDFKRQFWLSIPQWCDCYPAPTRQKSPAVCFQSHNGAIATGFPAATMVILGAFNPTMVRLLRQMKLARKLSLEPLSIPQWCDCYTSPNCNQVASP